MVILYVLLIAYILAVNFYAFLLVKALRDKEREAERIRQVNLAVEGNEYQKEEVQQKSERVTGKLCVTGLLGGAITIYVCMFLLKYKRSDLLLMVLMPLIGVLNIYLWVLLFRSGFSFLVFR